MGSADRWPDACALQDSTGKTSYAELAGNARRVAAWLADAGVKRGDRVALLAEAGAAYVSAYYGALMAGAATVSLNAAARAEELSGWIAHSEASALFVDGRHPEASEVVEKLPPDVRILAHGASPLGPECDEYADVISATGDSGVFVDCGENWPAALIYTSGTTNRPKAVVLDHGNLAANTDSIIEYLALTSSDSIACVLPFYYSFGNSVLHTHLASGARIVLEPNLVYPHRVVETMAREAVTGFAGVPSTFGLLMARVRLDQFDLSALRYVTQAGGPMAPAMIEKLRSLLPKVKIFIMYGQTEASARLTYLPPEKLVEKLGSVGIPIPGVEIEVRDEDGREVSSGVSGELWARGRNVMVGYWKDQAATNETIVDGWLRTGDAGWMDQDGYLFLNGRRSDIIKVGAHRVYPRDIESVIEELPGVKEVAVLGENDEILGQVVKACIVADTDAVLTETAVRAHCRAKLATYKVPKLVEFLSVLPKTSSGKVRRFMLSSNSSR